MCGRYVSTRRASDLAAWFDAQDDTGDGLTESYNVAPTDPVPIVRRSRRDGEPDAGRAVSVARWGLLPPWIRDTRAAARMINARSETVVTAPAYRSAFADRRCLVPADGWYEWCARPDGPGKQAYYLGRRDGAVLAFAGLWERREQALTCTVLTMPALGELASVHTRMPLLLAPDRWAGWLGEAGGLPAEELLAPPAAGVLDALEIRPVGPAVGDVRNNGPELRRPVPPPAPEPVNLTLF